MKRNVQTFYQKMISFPDIYDMDYHISPLLSPYLLLQTCIKLYTSDKQYSIYFLYFVDKYQNLRLWLKRKKKKKVGNA